jgi:hypothetical protein
MSQTEREQVLNLQTAAAEALAAGRDDAAMATFAEVTQLARDRLSPTDPIRLAAACAYGQAWFERRDDPDTALQIARAAYDEAIYAIDDAPDEQYRAAVAQLSELRDLMTFWAFRMSTSG